MQQQGSSYTLQFIDSRTPTSCCSQVNFALQGCVAKFEELLTKLSESEDTGARQQLHAAVVECKCLIVAVAIISPSDLIKIARCKMDEGTKYPKPCDDLKGIVVGQDMT